MPSTFMTLEEMQRRAPSPLDAMVVNTFRASQLLEALTFKTLSGRASEDYVITEELPAPQRRGLNQDFSRNRGTTSPGNRPAKIYGGRIGGDRAGRKMGLSDPVDETALQAQSTRLLVEWDLVYGDPDTDGRQFCGLQYFAESSGYATDTSISAGATAGGAALSVRLLRDAIDNCNPGATHLVMSRSLRNLLTGGAENTGVAGYIEWQTDPFGRRVASFDGLPIVAMDRGYDRSKILAYNEAAASGGATATSVYIVSHRQDAGWYPFQVGGVSVDPLAPTGVQSDRDIEWILATNQKDPLSVVRIKHIGELAVIS